MQNSSKGNNSWKNHRTRTRRWYAHPPSILNIPMKFQWNPTSSFREFAWTRTVPYIFMQNSSKGNNSWKNHRTRTRRWYAHPPLILNIPMKFHWNPTSSFREFAWTRAGRTHGRTDTRTYGRTDARTHGRSGDYMLPRNSSGSIIRKKPSLRKHTYSNILRILLPNYENFQMKKTCSFHTSTQNIDCRYLLEPLRRGGSNKYPQSMFLSRNKKVNVYPCKPQFYRIKVGFNGVKTIYFFFRYVFVM